MNLFRQQDLPPSLQKVQFQAKVLRHLLDLEDNRTLPGSLEIRSAADELLDFLDRAYPPKEPKQLEMFPPKEQPPRQKPHSWSLKSNLPRRNSPQAGL